MNFFYAACVTFCSFLCLACEQTVERAQDVQKIEIYYRDFSTMSPYSYSSADLEKSAPVKRFITNSADIDGLLSALMIPCRKVYGFSEKKMDVYLLAKIYKREGVVVWKASNFHYYVSSQSQVCVMESNERDKLKATITSIDSASYPPRIQL